MISDYLDQSYVLAQARAQRDWLEDLARQVRAKDERALAALRRYDVTLKEITRAIDALDASLAADARRKPGTETAFIPSDPVLCGLQTGLTTLADQQANTMASDVSAGTTKTSGTRGKSSGAAAPPTPGGRKRRKLPAGAVDTSATERLKRRSPAGAAPTDGGAITKAAFVEGDDIHYGLDGFKAKFGALFAGRHAFNSQPARIARSNKPLRLFVFGDWGTGLPLAQQVTARVREQLADSDGTRQQHVVHLGDVYYVGEAQEYVERVLASHLWPVSGEDRDRIGSWSLNGNHDMYAGGHGYFEVLLTDRRFLRWHRDAAGKPSSFFLIEDADWQFFGLDTSWNLPSLTNAVFGSPTLKDYGGQNGILNAEQATWMAQQRDMAKGCVLLTHHQPASSRTHEGQHADEAVRALKKAGVYESIDAWLWGHEHRAVVFKPKEQRTTPRLADAPGFCACLGHGGVPVTAENFARDKRIADVRWEEDRLDATSPVYEGERILPFGFARIDTLPGTLDLRIFDHAGTERFQTLVRRSTSA